MNVPSMQCSTNRSCCREYKLIGFICAVELVFGSLLAVCAVCLICNVGLCCKCCFYLLSVIIVVFCMSSVDVTYCISNKIMFMLQITELLLLTNLKSDN